MAVQFADTGFEELKILDSICHLLHWNDKRLHLYLFWLPFMLWIIHMLQNFLKLRVLVSF